MDGAPTLFSGASGEPTLKLNDDNEFQRESEGKGGHFAGAAELTQDQRRTGVRSRTRGSCCPMRVAVVFDTSYSGWDHPQHQAQMEREVAAWKVDEPEMEYQIAHALQERGHEVRLLG